MKTIQHKFVEFIPEQLENGILYVSLEYCTAVHKCICGCGNEVVTPFSPDDWQLYFDGKNVTLYPSIGNWNFECKSHYLIVKNQIKFIRSCLETKVSFKKKSNNTKKKKYNKRKD
jgi:hypothetical protein